MSIEKATFGAGCFWGVEELFRNTKGVTSAASGYAGGTTENPTYEQVCSHETGHAEVVEVEFDPAQVSYDHLLDVFWSNHNPTTRNRQGPDVGSQYRSVVFYHSPEQKAAAEKKMAELDKSGRFPRPIVTQIEPAPAFYRAEEYHQQYLRKHGRSHCAI
jgi:peptide-methionine (S)-S-oxide reductase